ncbi:MAG TPA: SDR family NAD(P)-dependent oxidoreductase [Flavisolibacter sp.]
MKRVIIIGASSGIGKELAKLYAKEGNLVGITGRRNDLLLQMKETFPANVLTSCFDVTGNDCRKHLEQLISDMGGLDLLIYNAGIGDPSIELIDEAEMITTQTNVVGFVALVTYAFNYFAKKGAGQIALTSSIAALRGNSWTPAYSASKAFMSNYAEGLSIKAYRLKNDIAITDIKPGFIQTKMAKGNGQFWVASPKKASRQIKDAIDKKKRVVYITHRWWLVAQALKLLPFFFYKRIA